MKSRRLVFLLAAALLGALPAVCGAQAGAAQGVLAWVVRFREGLPALKPEEALARAAADYAAVLAASGCLAHRDGAGRNALARYRAAGGSAVRVGEILGAGPSLSAVTAAWEASAAHAAAARDPRWTHVGAASAPALAAAAVGGEFWVVLFAEQRVEDFRLVREPAGGFLVSGIFRDARAAAPMLLSGLGILPPAAWDPGRREFRFRLPEEAGPRYHRLGYRTPEGGFFLTSAFYPELSAER